MLGQLVEFAIGAGLEAGRIGLLKEQCVGPAAEIAQAQGWVSVGRLRTRMGLSLRDARFVLGVACNRGLLYEAVNGRFYPAASASPPLTPAQNATIFAPLPHEPSSAPIAARTSRKTRWTAILFCWAAVTVGGVTWCVSRLERPAAPAAHYPFGSVPIAASAASPSTAQPDKTISQTEMDRRATRVSAALNAPSANSAPAKHPTAKHGRRHGHSQASR